MYKKIFVAIDDSETSKKALDRAIELAKLSGAELCIGHAADESLLVQHGMGLGSYIDVERTKKAIRASSEELLAAAISAAAVAGVVADSRLLEATDKRVAEMIAEGAAEWGGDLIVVGAHGRRGVVSLLVGSVADNLMRLAGSSLLLVRAD